MVELSDTGRTIRGKPGIDEDFLATPIMPDPIHTAIYGTDPGIVTISASTENPAGGMSNGPRRPHTADLGAAREPDQDV
jgi:hypothetical protein